MSAFPSYPVAFSSALSNAGVKYLAASPETMLAPGVPTDVAHDIASHIGDPQAMANAVVDTTMNTTYGSFGTTFGPAAAFDVIDLDPAKQAAVQSAVKALDGKLVDAAADPTQRAAIKHDAGKIAGMVRFPEGKGMPWKADRPAVALYDALAKDTQLGTALRGAARHAADTIASTVMAHGESRDFEPFNDANYGNAFGPTVHFPLTHKQNDPWAPQISETDNAFYGAVGGDAVAHALA